MSTKQIALKLNRLSGKIRNRQEELSSWKEEARTLRTKLANAKAKEKGKRR